MEKLRRALKKENGITLIALVITIVVMLILAGVTINLTLGENGIFTTAQQAVKNYTDAQNKELAELNNFTNLINNTIGDLGNGNIENAGTVTPEEPETLPENTSTTPSGTQVQKPADKTWDETKINSYADGIGNTIPVPVGFSPITTAEGQGTKLTGFVIKNNTDGNEFVWVPVGSVENYKRVGWTRDGWTYRQTLDETTGKITRADLDAQTCYYTEEMPQDEYNSVSIYGGYYIGRYEAGVKDYETKNTTSDGTTTWTAYTGEDTTLVIQDDQEVWNYITRDKAKAVAEDLYDKTTDNVDSKLCSSYAWDSALKFIETQNSTYPTNSVGGYYEQSSPTTTGYDTAHPCNIYDMGGNVWEWTTESFSDTACVVRGGNYVFSTSAHPAAVRANSTTTTDPGTGGDFSFRVTLFM